MTPLKCPTHVQVPDILQQFPVFATYSKGDFSSSVSFSHASGLSEEQRGAVWSIFEANMRDIYSKDDQKWNPKEKRRELFDVSCLFACWAHTERQQPQTLICRVVGSCQWWQLRPWQKKLCGRGQPMCSQPVGPRVLCC